MCLLGKEWGGGRAHMFVLSVNSLKACLDLVVVFHYVLKYHLTLYGDRAIFKDLLLVVISLVALTIYFD